MRRVVLPILLLALTAVAWPATVAHAHYPLHAWTNAQDCEVVVRLSTHVGSNHSHSFPGFEDWTLNLMLRIIPSGHEKTTSLLLGFQEPKIDDTWAAFSLRDTTHYANYSADTTWTWMLYYVWMVPNRESGKIALIGATPIQGLTDRVPTHCLTPPPPKCQFSGGFGYWTQQHSGAGDCRNIELHVGGGSLQPTENGILFYERDSQRLGFFTWARVWQALVSTPFTEPRPWLMYDPQPATGLPALVHCQLAGKLGDWTQRYSNAGACHDKWQHLGGGSLQSTEHGILFHDPSGQRLGLFDWTRVWQALVPMPFSEPQPGRSSYSQTETGVSTAGHCQYSGGFGNWVRQNPISGNCQNNELHIPGGSLQSTENGILFYHRENQRLDFFDWTSTWQALRSLPLSVPQSRQSLSAPSGPNRSANVRCQYTAGYTDWRNPRSPNFNNHPDYIRQDEEGYSDWVVLHANAGACHNHEQFVEGGVVQSAENGILFYDHDRLRLEFFDWSRVWHALAAPPSAVTQPVPTMKTPAVTGIPAAAHCQFILGFGHWVQTNPGVGNCHNNELSVSGGSLQSAQNGILFYDHDNQRLAHSSTGPRSGKLSLLYLLPNRNFNPLLEPQTASSLPIRPRLCQLGAATRRRGSLPQQRTVPGKRLRPIYPERHPLLRQQQPAIGILQLGAGVARTGFTCQ